MLFRNENSHKTQLKIFCVCGGFGFPFGTASTNRVKLMGRCFVYQNIPFHVFHLGPSPFKENVINKGEVAGITFEYLSPSVIWPSNKWIRIFYYLYGYIKLISRLIKIPENSVVYIYYQGDFKNLLILLLCRVLRKKVAQEVCEWWSGTEKGSWFTKLMYERIMFRLSDGALPISHEINNRIRSLTNPDYPLCIVPVLTDSDSLYKLKIKNTVNDDSNTDQQKFFLWCGMVDGYKRDVLFLIDGLSKIKPHFKNKYLLKIVGPCTEKCRLELICYARTKGVNEDQITIVGFVSDEELWGFCTTALGLLMPLWDNDRSLTRFPTKFGQFIAAGRPIVTSPIGEMNYYLNDSSALLYQPGNSSELACCLEKLLHNPELGIILAKNATERILSSIEIKSNTVKITHFFEKLIENEKS